MTAMKFWELLANDPDMLYIHDTSNYIVDACDDPYEMLQAIRKVRNRKVDLNKTEIDFELKRISLYLKGD